MVGPSDRSVVADVVERIDAAPTEYQPIIDRVSLVRNVYAFEIGKYLPLPLKNPFYRRFGVEIGDGTALAPHVQVDPFHPEKITIGSDTVIGWGTKLLTHETYADEWHVGPIEIGSNVTFGHSSSTRPGVTIGDGATVAAHSFVNRDVEPGEKVGGVPIETL